MPYYAIPYHSNTEQCKWNALQCKSKAMQKYNTIQYNTIQYNTIQYNTFFKFKILFLCQITNNVDFYDKPLPHPICC
jgi:hypothetical protein